MPKKPLFQVGLELEIPVSEQFNQLTCTQLN
jgi:hypothetical protein